MDPNANLQEQERILRLTPTQRKILDRNVRLSELRWELKVWLVGGGFEPDWSKAPNARKYYGR